MAQTLKSGQTVTVTITKLVPRHAAHMTLQRLFMTDKAVARPLAIRSSYFKPLPKRRGGCIWTKYPNAIRPELSAGKSATIKLTPQYIRDLASVADVVEVK